MNNAHRPKALIITADDFGLHVAINEAVELAHRHGVLTTASLMVAAPAAADAINRARRLRDLGVGLHLVLADGPSMLPHAAIPDLVSRAGYFGDRMALDGARFFFLPRIRRQLEKEIRAQFEAFRRTGLTLDHVNAHKHFHLHPTILSSILRIGPEYGMRAVRLPAEPSVMPLLLPWLWLMRMRLRRRRIRCNDHVFGLSASGRMNESQCLAALERLPDGVSELYLHPAVHDRLTGSMAGYQHLAELESLLSPRVRQAIAASGATTGSFASVLH